MLSGIKNSMNPNMWVNATTLCTLATFSILAGKNLVILNPLSFGIYGTIFTITALAAHLLTKPREDDENSVCFFKNSFKFVTPLILTPIVYKLVLGFSMARPELYSLTAAVLTARLALNIATSIIAKFAESDELIGLNGEN